MHPCMLRRHYSDAQLDTIAQAAHESASFGSHASLAMVRAELASSSDYRVHQLCAELKPLKKLALPPRQLFDSAKLKLLASLLPQLRADGHRALIFSQSTQMLDILEEFVGDGPGGLGLTHLRLDGSTPVADRQAMIDKYQRSDEVFVFLLSTRAGGQGINLTGADTVIIHDLDWNPQLDIQAEDRAHRIGQTRAVRVIRLLSAGTVDENILALQKRKKVLNDKLLGAEAVPDSAEPDMQVMSEILREALEIPDET
jgi:SWI/SNF-related matrix-associated actin-dependent regulator 1 of chromatin subfamily A